MTNDIRTPRGRLVGKYDDQTSIFSIKDGKRITEIIIPPNGLKLSYTTGDGVTEDVCIPPKIDVNHVA